MVDIEQLRVEYFQNDIPVKYNLQCKSDIFIYPIKVKDWYKMNDFAVFNIKKNEINDIDIIKMSYLQFLNEVYFIQYSDEKEKFLNIMCLCFGLINGQVQFGYKSNKIMLVILDNEEKIVSIISSKEFDDISKIILFQNIVDYNDDYVSPIMTKIIQDYFSALPKDRKIPILEDKKIYMFSKMNISMQDINNMSYRLFCQTYEMLYDCEEYLSTRIMQASEKFKIEEKVEHPLYKIKPTIFEQVVGNKNNIYKELNKVQ